MIAPWVSSVVFVCKKGGNMSSSIDYKQLDSSLSYVNVLTLPRVDDTLDLLAHNRWFSTLDSASGYYQVTMDSESRQKTAFVTTSGLYGCTHAFWSV